MSFKDFLFIVFAVVVLVIVIYLGSQSSNLNSPNGLSSTSREAVISNNKNNNMALNLSSLAFSNNSNIPAKYTCDSENIVPPLKIEGTDPNAKSLVLIVDDPDAASVVGHTFDHWVKFNIDPRTLTIEEGKEPLGTAGKGGANNLTYTGPCPPNGTHHYHFKLYSLDTKLTLPEGSTKAEVEAAMQGHILQQTELIGLYTRYQK
ncbi:MAG TPA: YbhB/YbcL family Raf kinase inhibitor-like protein [Candidatus Paceibacterota bacterium]|nr:YbhB/YbcL family Raf kinase inhibitor-like protein [Candidatus Paceibacterota bacterium]